MGGYGSGKQGDGRTCEGAKRFDLRDLVKRDRLRPGLYSYSWTRRGYDGERIPTGSITYEITGKPVSRILLSYRTCYEGGPWEDVEERVSVIWTPCHYGGARPWLSCPKCDRRCQVLYCHGTRFVCRNCARLLYQTQTEKLADRLVTKSWRIRKRLGQEGGGIFDFFPEKPKGMHWKTYYRLKEQAREAEYEDMLLAAKRFGLDTRG